MGLNVVFGEGYLGDEFQGQGLDVLVLVVSFPGSSLGGKRCMRAVGGTAELNP